MQTTSNSFRVKRVNLTYSPERARIALSQSDASARLSPSHNLSNDLPPENLADGHSAGLASGLSWHNDFVRVYEELKRIARRQRYDAKDTLNTTAIVHELYLQLSDRTDLNFQAQRQFFNYAAQAMRHLLIDRARTRQTHRRGGMLQMVSMSEAENEATAIQHQTIELDQALEKLAERDPRACEVFSLVFFAGLSNQRVAELLKVSTRTIDRDWLFARAWLQAHIVPSSA